MQKIIDFGLLSILLVFPLAINIALVSPSEPNQPIIALNFSLADIFIGFILMLWIIKVISSGEWKLIKLPTAPILIFVIISILSFVDAISLSEWAKESIQLIEYFIILYLLLINNLKGLKIHYFKTMLFVFASINLLLALIQNIFLNADPYLVRGLFNNHNVLGLFLSMAVPLIYIELLHAKNNLKKTWMAILLMLSVINLTSGSALFSVLLSLIIMSFMHSRKVLIRFIPVVLVLGIIYPFVMPSKNVDSIKDFVSIYEQGSISKSYYRRFSMLEDAEKILLLEYGVGENSLKIKTNNYFSAALPAPEKGSRYQNMAGQTHIKNRYLEMQASLNLISENTLLGVGTGNFQKHIGTYYNELPKINTAEPNQNNGYLIIASTMGLFGLTSLIWLFFSILKTIKRKITLLSAEGIFSLGLFGSILACVIENFFTYLFTASMLVPFIFLVYLSLSPKETSDAIS